jgi:hypothetical protein
MCRRPVPGVVWQCLHYLLGLERLGFEAYYVEWHGRWVPDPDSFPGDSREPRVLVGQVLAKHGFGDRWICRADHLGEGGCYGGLPQGALACLYREAEAVVNVTGSHVLDDDQLACPRRVYVETDPGIPQIRLAEGDAATWRLVGGHTHVFTFGENIHGSDCLLPDTSLRYETTRQPVEVELWDAPVRDAGRYTTVSRWRKPRPKRIAHRGELYEWDKEAEFQKLLDLPARAPRPLELALGGASEDERLELERHGWRTRDAVSDFVTLAGYRRYIRESRGELTVAKDQYVRLRTGWFSDRSACYLAAGRPVITQDTGLSAILPTGEGLLCYEGVDGALAALEAVEADYDRHSAAAREIAREFFDSDRVLAPLLAAIGLDVVVATSP